jgi:ribosomal protein L31E
MTLTTVFLMALVLYAPHRQEMADYMAETKQRRCVQTIKSRVERKIKAKTVVCQTGFCRRVYTTIAGNNPPYTVSIIPARVSWPKD